MEGMRTRREKHPAQGRRLMHNRDPEVLHGFVRGTRRSPFAFPVHSLRATVGDVGLPMTPHGGCPIGGVILGPRKAARVAWAPSFRSPC